MVEPEWFFSTLAQSTAAIAGLIIAFSAVLYQVERRNREGRTEEVRERLLELKDKYEMVIGEMSSELIDIGEGHEPSRGHLQNMLDFEILEADFEDMPDIIEAYEDLEAENPNTLIYGAHLNRLAYYFHSIDPSTDPMEHYLFTEEEFDSFIETLDWLDENIRQNTDFMNNVTDEFMEFFGDEYDLNDDNNVIYWNCLPTTNPALPENTNLIREWLGDYMEDHRYVLDRDTGENLHSYRRVWHELKLDFREIHAMVPNTMIGYSSHVRGILTASGALLVFGAFIPILFLMDSSAIVSNWSIDGSLLLAIESVNLIVSASITGYLLWLIGKNLEYTN